MKKSQGLIMLALLASVFMFMSSCRKEPNPRCGKDDRCRKECSLTGTVEYLPAQCGGVSGQLGIKSSEGQYIMVCEDKTGKFSSLNAGDKICYDGAAIQCVVCEACDCPAPDRSISLTCVANCGTTTRQN